MKEPADGGPAFPSLIEREALSNHGMSLRDYFAAKALTGIFASNSHRSVASAIESDCMREGILTTPTDIGHFAEQRIAAMAYAMADAMLAERAKGTPQS